MGDVELPAGLNGWLTTAQKVALEEYVQQRITLASRPAIDMSKLQRWEMEIEPNGRSASIRSYKDDTADWVKYDDVAALIEGETK